jgi:hypothetical protein
MKRGYFYTPDSISGDRDTKNLSIFMPLNLFVSNILLLSLSLSLSLSHNQFLTRIRVFNSRARGDIRFFLLREKMHNKFIAETEIRERVRDKHAVLPLRFRKSTDH